MKDAELQILHAFLFALAQQDEPLANTVQNQLHEIAQALDQRVAELHKLAISTPSLAVPYRQAYRLLNERAGEKAKGFEPNLKTDQALEEKTNFVSDTFDRISDDLKFLDALQQKYKKPEEAAAILASTNSVQQPRLFWLTLHKQQSL